MGYVTETFLEHWAEIWCFEGKVVNLQGEGRTPCTVNLKVIALWGKMKDKRRAG